MSIGITRKIIVTILALAFYSVSYAGNSCQSVEREMAYGTAALEGAKDRAGYLRSAKEFEAAVKKAPKCAAAHFNLGLVYEKADKFKEALGSLQSYLRLSPKASDAAEVRNKIYKLEYRLKDAGRVKAKEDALIEGRWTIIHAWSQQEHTSKTAEPTLQSDGWASYMLRKLDAPTSITVRGDRFNTSFRMSNLKNRNRTSFNFEGKVSGRSIRGTAQVLGRCVEFCGSCEVGGNFPFSGEVSKNGKTLMFVIDTRSDSCVGSFGAWWASVRLSR